MNILNALLRGFVAATLGLVATPTLAGGTIETLVVTSTADTETPGTLRQAVLDANGSASAQVEIAFDLPDGSNVLLTSDLPILSHQSVKVLNSHPSRQVAIDGDLSYRVFQQVGSDATLFVIDLEIREGWMDASGVSGGGACLFTQGRAVLQNARFVGCQAINGSGAAVHARESALIGDSSFISNRVFQDGTIPVSQGGAVYCQGSTCSIAGSTFDDNQVFTQLPGQTERGGGAALLNGDEITIHNTKFLRNQGLGRGGALHLLPSQAGSFIHITDSLFRDNFSGEGGAVYVQGLDSGQSLVLERNSIEGNAAALRAPALRISQMPEVTLTGNVFYMQESGNSSAAWGSVDIFSNSSTPSNVTLDFNTFVGDDENSYLLRISETATDDVTVTRFHANIFDQRATRPACLENATQLTPDTGLFNVVSDDSCTSSIEAGSLTNIDPSLSDAVSRPDRTLVYPGNASPAVDLVTSEGLVTCSGQTDLGGTTRPLDGDGDGTGHCDAGALERNVWLFTDRFED